jgi:putative transposase
VKLFPPVVNVNGNAVFIRGHKWQRRLWVHLITDQNDFNRHIDYIHVNPLKHGLVKRVADWPHSSFHRYVKQGNYPLHWAGEMDNEFSAGEHPEFSETHKTHLT